MNKSVLHVGGFFVIVMLAASGWGWLRLPEDAMLPIHWGADLKPGGLTSKTTGLLFLPLLALTTRVVLALAPRFDPRRDNLLRSDRAYVAAQFAVLAFFALLHLAVIMQASGSGISMETVLPIRHPYPRTPRPETLFQRIEPWCHFVFAGTSFSPVIISWNSSSRSTLGKTNTPDFFRFPHRVSTAGSLRISS